MKKLVLAAMVFSICTLSNFISLAQTPKSDTLGKRLPVLNDKYSFVFPAGSKNIPRVADIMAADPNVNRETRIIFENGNHKLVFFAQELYALGGKTLFEELLKEEEKEFDFDRKLLADQDSLLSIISNPRLFDTANAAILLSSLLVKSPDNTLSRIDAFINPEAFSAKDTYRKMAEEIFRTISKGNRRIDLAPKVESYKIFGTEARLEFTLPANYYITVDEKYDFGVFKINKYKNSITDTIYTGISIYAGQHPNFFHADYGYKFGQAIKTTGQFLQSPVEWMYFKDDAQSFYLKEQIFPAANIQEGLVLHTAMLTNKKQNLEEMNKIVESIKLLK